jgi:hypothetical protein
VRAHGWQSSLVGTVMSVGGVAGMIAIKFLKIGRL